MGILWIWKHWVTTELECFAVNWPVYTGFTSDQSLCGYFFCFYIIDICYWEFGQKLQCKTRTGDQVGFVPTCVDATRGIFLVTWTWVIQKPICNFLPPPLLVKQRSKLQTPNIKHEQNRRKIQPIRPWASNLIHPDPGSPRIRWRRQGLRTNCDISLHRAYVLPLLRTHLLAFSIVVSLWKRKEKLVGGPTVEEGMMILSLVKDLGLL